MPKKRASSSGANQTLIYQIRVKGHLGRSWEDWFEDATIILEEDGNTLLICRVIDQAGLHGLLKKVRDLGMPLISVVRMDPAPPKAADD